MPFGALVAALINLNGPGHYVHWGFVQISVANLVVILLMIAVFVLAIVLPFPRRKDPTGEHRHQVGHRRPDDAEARQWTARTERRFDCVPSGPSAARPPARLYGLVGLRVRCADGRRPGLGDRDGLRARRHGPELVAYLLGRPLRELPSPMECGGVLLLHGHPPVGQVLYGGLARQPAADLGHGCHLLRPVGGGAFTGYLSQQNFDSQWISTQAKDGINATGPARSGTFSTSGRC